MKKLMIISCFLISTSAAIASPKHTGLPEEKPEPKKESIPTTRILNTNVPDFCLDERNPTDKGRSEICEEVLEEVQKDYMEELENKN
jgi:hypothetical protein